MTLFRLELLLECYLVECFYHVPSCNVTITCLSQHSIQEVGATLSVVEPLLWFHLLDIYREGAIVKERFT